MKVSRAADLSANSDASTVTEKLTETETHIM